MNLVSEKNADSELISHVLKGETPRFEILIRRYNPLLYKIGRSYGFSHQDTEDLMQDTFIDAYTNLSKFEGRSAFKTWLTGIMLHNCYRRRHKKSFTNEIDGETLIKSSPMTEGNQNGNPVGRILNRELGTVIEKALEQIPFNYRIVFALREMNGLSVRDTAGLLHLTTVNVKTRLNRARVMLRKEVEKFYSVEEIYEFNLIYCDGIVARVMEKINAMEEGGLHEQ